MSGERLFLHRLALALGMTVADLRARMSASEFADWRTFCRQEMIGEERADLRHALASALLANLNRGRGQPPHSWQDFMPFRPRPEASPEEFARAVGAI